jgi:hypothetical protein
MPNTFNAFPLAFWVNRKKYLWTDNVDHSLKETEGSLWEPWDVWDHPLWHSCPKPQAHLFLRCFGPLHCQVSQLGWDGAHPQLHLLGPTSLPPRAGPLSKRGKTVISNLWAARRGWEWRVPILIHTYNCAYWQQVLSEKVFSFHNCKVIYHHKYPYTLPPKPLLHGYT